MVLALLLLGCREQGTITVCTRQPAERQYWKVDRTVPPAGSTRLRLGNGRQPVYCGSARVPKGDSVVAVHDGACFSTWFDVTVRGQRARLDIDSWVCGGADTGLEETGLLPVPF